METHNQQGAGTRGAGRKFDPAGTLRGNGTEVARERARERMDAAIRGSTLSEEETVENKSHVVELSEKLGEPSIAVFHCDGTDGERGAAVELDGDKERVLTGLGLLFISLFRRGFGADVLEKVLEISTKRFYERAREALKGGAR